MQNIHVYSFVTKHWLTGSRMGAFKPNKGLNKHLILQFIFICEG